MIVENHTNKDLLRPYHSVEPNQKMVQQLVQKVAFSSLQELSIALAFTAVTCIFVTNPTLLIVFVAVTVSLVAFNTMARSGAAYCTYKFHQTDQEPYRRYAHYLKLICPISFGMLDITTRQVLVHEAGHAIAAQALYKNPQIHIEIKPFQGGVTKFRTGQLSKLGNYLGRHRTSMIVSAAGPAFGILLASSDLVISHQIRKSNPILSRYLLISAILNIAQHTLYALSTFWDKMPGHDFVKLAAGGIHPLAAVITMIAIPLLLKGGLILVDRLKERQLVLAS